jgi:hypothetical protein
VLAWWQRRSAVVLQVQPLRVARRIVSLAVCLHTCYDAAECVPFPTHFWHVHSVLNHLLLPFRWVRVEWAPHVAILAALCSSCLAADFLALPPLPWGVHFRDYFQRLLPLSY